MWFWKCKNAGMLTCSSYFNMLRFLSSVCTCIYLFISSFWVFSNLECQPKSINFHKVLTLVDEACIIINIVLISVFLWVMSFAAQQQALEPPYTLFSFFKEFIHSTFIWFSPFVEASIYCFFMRVFSCSCIQLIEGLFILYPRLYIGILVVLTLDIFLWSGQGWS